MSKENFTHYNCDFCEKEVVDKDNNTNNWIAIAKGSSSFNEREPLRIINMTKKWDSYADKKYDIHDNVYFCCVECMVKFLLKHLTQNEVIPESLKENFPKIGVTPPEEQPRKNPTRFESIEVSGGVLGDESDTKSKPKSKKTSVAEAAATG